MYYLPRHLWTPLLFSLFISVEGFVPCSHPNTFMSHVIQTSSSPAAVSEFSSCTKNSVSKMVASGISETIASNPRSCVLQIGVSVGRLCGVANSHLIQDATSPHQTNVLVSAIGDLFGDLFRTSQSLHLNLIQCIHNKLELNNRKYPVELCKGRSGKYTAYSDDTGITTTNQSTMDGLTTDGRRLVSSDTLSLSDFASAIPELALTIKDFSEAREWSRFHTPRNIVLALLGEVGELAELLQWKGDDCDWSELEPATVDKLSQELADVSIYLLRLASVTHVVEPLSTTMADLVD
eukprot:Nitzschia sp. Nitz4//scaffold285_size24199//6968//7915//NITZ4_008422-RA/size24199-snap-gene-0.17-mRNA-1//1//CDS//3329545707//791//frame0